jgi:hypothetical protein
MRQTKGKFCGVSSRNQRNVEQIFDEILLETLTQTCEIISNAMQSSITEVVICIRNFIRICEPKS